MPDEGKSRVGQKCARRLPGPAFTVLDSWHDHPGHTEICFVPGSLSMEEQMNTNLRLPGAKLTEKRWKRYMEELGTIQDTSDHAMTSM